MVLFLKEKKIRLYFATLSSLLIVTACASGEKKEEEPVKASEGPAESSRNGDSDQDEGSGKPASFYAGSERTTLINSLSNNQLTSHTIATGKADGLADKFQGKDKKSLEARISAERLSRKSGPQVLSSAKKLAELEMEKGAGRSVSDDVKLEIALAAITSKNYSLAEYYLQDLTSSKDAKAKAGAYNALGVIALKDERVPEATLYFKEALKANGSYRPALLNLGFVALKGGDLGTAKRALESMGNDWFVQYGMITIARLDGNEGNATEACERVLKKEPGHRAALFNCALLEFQNKKNYGKAKELVSKATNARGGESGWDSRAIELGNKIDFAFAEEKSKNAKDKEQKAPPPTK
jgi:tetratricopeptide (TPR) repeat protein